jgi:hypothetical protein
MNRFQKLSFEQVLGEKERTDGVNGGGGYETLIGDAVILPEIEDMKFDFESMVGFDAGEFGLSD